jgi:hypothetical protein
MAVRPSADSVRIAGLMGFPDLVGRGCADTHGRFERAAPCAPLWRWSGGVCVRLHAGADILAGLHVEIP